MAHRVNFKVYRLGKTIKWNFLAPLINVQKLARLNYIMSHWIRRVLFDCNIKIFKFFYSASPDFPFIKIIGYRKLYIKSKKIVSGHNFTLKSSYLLDSDKLFDFSKNKISNELTFYRQREKNRKLISVKEPSKQRKAGYKNIKLPLLFNADASNRIFNFFLLEIRPAVSSLNVLSCINWSFNHIFVLNAFVVFSLFGSTNSANAKNANSAWLFKSLAATSSYTSLILKDLLQTESMGWFKFTMSYIHLFLSAYSFEESSKLIFFFKSATFLDIYHFFLLKKTFFVIKLICKNYPQSIFLKTVSSSSKRNEMNKSQIFSNSSFFLNIIRFYLFIAKDKNFETRFFSTAEEGAFKIRSRPSYYLLLKLKFAILFFKNISKFKLRIGSFLTNVKFENFYLKPAFNHILKNVFLKIIFNWRNLLSEINVFWTRDFSFDYKQTSDKFESAAKLSTQFVLFLDAKTNIKCSKNLEFLEPFSLFWWRSRFSLSSEFNYDFLYNFVMSYSKHSEFAAKNFLAYFSTSFSNSALFKYFQSWSYIFLNGNLELISFNTAEKEFGRSGKKKYVRPTKAFADIDNALSIKIPVSYQNLLKNSLKSSSVFSFADYELKLQTEASDYLISNKPKKFFKKAIDNLLFLLARAETEKFFFIPVFVRPNRSLFQVINSVANKFLLHYKKMLFSNFFSCNFFYSTRIIKYLENALTFLRASQYIEPGSNFNFFNNTFFKMVVPAANNAFANFFNYKVVAEYCFLNQGQYFFTKLNTEELSGFKKLYNKDSMVYLQKSTEDSLVFIGTSFSYVRPGIVPFGVLKRSAEASKKLFFTSFNFFSINFNFLKLDFLFSKNIINVAASVNFFKIFKNNIFFKLRYFVYQPITVFFFTMYGANNLIDRRKFDSNSNGLTSFSSALPAFNFNSESLSSMDANLASGTANKFKLFNLVNRQRPHLKLSNSLNNFFHESYYLLNLSSLFYKVFGISYEIVFYPISRVFQDNARFQFLISQAGDFLKAYVSRNPYVLYWLNEFIVLFYASIATRSTKALSQFMAERFKKEYYWNQPAAFMFSVIRSIMLKEFGILGMRIGFHGKFGGQERAYRLYKTWGANPCLRNGLLTGSHSSSRCHSKYGITDIHIWLVYY